MNSPKQPEKQSDGRVGKLILPSWLTSVAVHVTLFFISAASLRSCSSGVPQGAAAEEFRDVGIYVKQPEQPFAEVEPQPPQPETEVVEEKQEPVEQPVPKEQPQIDQPPPAEPELPKNPIIGAGVPQAPPGDVIDVQTLVKPPTIQPGGGPAKLGNGETSFLDIRDKANRFCYLIDTSGSMHGAAMRYARNQLKSSLNQLTKTQEFQVIFYNEHVKEMRLPAPARMTGKLYRATSTNVTLAARFIETVTPNVGTDHVPALVKALALRPEVLFFLTDGTEPRLYERDLQAIRQSNVGTRIHCIEFGKGPALGVSNWLERLASMNGGTYRYQNVRQLGR